MGGLLALAIGTWRSFPIEEGDTPRAPGLRVVLFDVSAGTTRLRPAHGVWARRRLREEALAAEAAGEELGLGLYAADVRRLGLEPAGDWLARLEGRGGEALALGSEGAAGLGSELDAGLALFEPELLRLDRPGARLSIYGERDYSGADPHPRLSRLQAAGVRIDWMAPEPPTRLDLGIEGLDLPTSPEPGAPLVGRFHLALAPGGRTRAQLSESHEFELLLLLQGAGAPREERVGLELPTDFREQQGYLRWSARVDLGSAAPGLNRVAARVVLRRRADGAEGDPVPENDRRSAECRSGPTRLVAAVASAERLVDLRAWIGVRGERWPGLQFSFLEPSQLLSNLGHLDLLLTFDLSPAELPRELVTEFVRAGGGWFACGGWGALPGWGPGRGADSLGSLLPLIPEPEGRGPRDVIFVVDGSGSMAGGAFESVQRALGRLALAAGPEDRLWLRFFTGSLMGAVDLRVDPAGPAESLRKLFALRVPGGPTAILYSLDQLAAERAGAEHPGLTFLLSDGRDDVSHDVIARGRAIAAGLSAGESRLVVMAAGEDPDRELLGALIAPGAALLEAGDLEGLDELFQREVFRERVREGQLQLELAGAGRLAPSAELLGAWRAAGEVWPAHRRYLRCVARDDADVLLRSASAGEPLMAWRREGAGLVASWASCTLPEWAPDLGAADALFAPLWRLLAARDAGTPRPRLEVRDGALVLSEVPPDWPAQVAAELHAQVWGDNPAEPWIDQRLGEALLWPATAFSGDDPRTRREGQLPRALARGAHGRPLHVLLRGRPGGEPLGQVSLQVPCPPEFAPAGGRLVETPALSPGASPARLPREGRPDPRAWIWIVGGLCTLVLAALAGGLASGASGPGAPNSGLSHQGAGPSGR